MEFSHPMLIELKSLEEALGEKFLFLGERSDAIRTLIGKFPANPLNNYLYSALVHLLMAYKIMTISRRISYVLISEHKPQFALPIYICAMFRNKRVYFCVHSIQQICERTIFHRIGFKALQFLNHRGLMIAIQFERDDSVLHESYRFKPEHSLVIPLSHPRNKALTNEIRPLPKKDKPMVGIVGMIRPDKPYGKLLRFLEKHLETNANDYTLLVGTPYWNIYPEFENSNAVHIDTTNPSCFEQAFMECDIIVCDFLQKDFWFRPSGIINDAITFGCLVIAPEYPVFKEQISQPVNLGATFTTYAQIPALIQDLWTQLPEIRKAFPKWRASRSTERILAKFYEYEMTFRKNRHT